jgi:hypothetical protein
MSESGSSVQAFEEGGPVGAGEGHQHTHTTSSGQ